MPEGSSTSLAQIPGAEIMRVGTWNGTRFTPQDLADIAEAAPDVGFVPPLKVGHDESVGARAWGWIRNLRVAGEKLIGDLLDIPESLATIIRDRGYDQLSAEVYLDLDRNGKRFRRALKAVALLGAEVPAVSDLKPLRELFSAPSKIFDSSDERNGETVLLPSSDYQARAICFTNQHEGGPAMPEHNHPTASGAPPLPAQPDREVAKLREEAAALKSKAEAQSAQLAEQKAAADAQAAELTTLKAQSEAQATELKAQKDRTVELEAKNREIALTAKLDAWKGPPAFRPYLEAMYRTAGESPRTLKFSSEPGKTEDVPLEGVVDKLAEKLAGDTSWMLKQLSVVGGTDHYDDPGAEVDTRVKKLQAAKPDLSYGDGVTQVLNADPGLKTAYAGTGG